jgi:hypothetical protein
MTDSCARVGPFVACLAIVLTSCGDQGPRQLVATRALTFEQLFEEVRVVELDTAAVVAELSYVDIHRSGRIVVLDNVVNDVKLFGSDGRFQRSISGRECNPEANWRPKRAVQMPDSSIVVATLYEVYLFGPDGTCLRSLTAFEGVPRAMCAVSSKEVAGYFPRHGQFSVQTYDLSDDSVSFSELPNPRLPSLTVNLKVSNELACVGTDMRWLYPEMADAGRIAGGGIAAADAEFLPGYFTAIQSDLDITGSRQAAMESMASVTASGTVAVAVLSLDDGRRVVVHSGVPPVDGRGSLGIGVSILGSTGLSARTSIQNYPVAVDGNNVVFALPPRTEGATEIANPGLRVMRIRS